MYSITKDGEKMNVVERIERSIKADETLDNVGKMLKSELFGEAKNIIDAAREIYTNNGGEEVVARLEKTGVMLELVSNGSMYYDSIQNKQFPEAKVYIENAQSILNSLGTMEPASIVSLDGGIFGSKTAMDTVIDRALSSSLEEQDEARIFLDSGSFDLALKKCSKAMESYEWVAGYKGLEMVETLIGELNLFVKEIKRKEAWVLGEKAYNRAVEALAATPKAKLQVAILALREAEEMFLKR